ncbi:sensor histidine kinase, partial [bacterium]|nr:sensor histidine kinase [bacterium]
DLHDTLAQSISGVVLQLDAARCHFGDRPDESQHHLLRAADLARDGLLQARRAVWQLRDPSLQPGDIAQALIDMAQQLSVDSGIPIKVVISGEPLPLPEASEEQLLRISQEAITNALKHAQAQEIRVGLKFASGLVQLSIEDNGRGFDVLSTSSADPRFGLSGMRERVNQLKGTFSIDSKPGKGTTITVSLTMRDSI